MIISLLYHLLILLKRENWAWRTEFLTHAHHDLVIHYQWSLWHHLLIHTTAILLPATKLEKELIRHVTLSLNTNSRDQTQSAQKWVNTETACDFKKKQQQKAQLLWHWVYWHTYPILTLWPSSHPESASFIPRPSLAHVRSFLRLVWRRVVSEEVLAGSRDPWGWGDPPLFHYDQPNALLLGQTGSHGCFRVQRPIKRLARGKPTAVEPRY